MSSKALFYEKKDIGEIIKMYLPDNKTLGAKADILGRSNLIEKL
jgi:hypothetical protein